MKRFCRWYYELEGGEEPTKSQVNAVSKMCRDGTLPAFKVGRKWFIDMEKLRGATDGEEKNDAA